MSDNEEKQGSTEKAHRLHMDYLMNLFARDQLSVQKDNVSAGGFYGLRHLYTRKSIG